MKTKQKYNNKEIYGGIIGDMVGSIYEWKPIKDKAYDKSFSYWKGPMLFHHDGLPNYGSRFTDDTVCGLAIANALCKFVGPSKLFFDLIPNEKKCKELFVKSLKELCPKYEWVGYGERFYMWVVSHYNDEPYGSYGNGSAMRVFPIGLFYPLKPGNYDLVLKKTRELARWSAQITHDHPEGIKGAESVAAAMVMARAGKSKDEIREYIEAEFEYDLHRDLDVIRKDYQFDVSCQGSVPESILCFLKGENFEECIRYAVTMGGDADTMGCMTGAIAGCFHDIPNKMIKQCRARLDQELIDIIDRFEQTVIL